MSVSFSLAVLLLAATPAPNECNSKAGQPPGWIVLQSPGQTVELWRFGERLGKTPLKMSLAAGCAEIEARLADGSSQMLRLEVESGVEKTLAVKIEGQRPPPSPQAQAQALFEAATRGDPAARARVLSILEKALAAGGPVKDGPTPCVERDTGETGWATLEAQPAARFYYRGRSIGDSPLARFKFPAGCVQVEAVTPDGKRRTVDLRIEPNALRVYSFEIK